MSNILKNFWVIEGLDGAGTTTQMKLLSKELEKRGISFFSTCEPTEYETGLFLRKILSGEVKIPQSSIAHMFSTDRDNHLYNPEYGILKHINDNQIVISDRYFFSSLAYQSIGYDYDSVWTLNKGFPFPEYVIFIDTPVSSCMERINSRGNVKEIFEKKEFLDQVYLGYQKCLKNLPQGCNLIKVDGTKSKEDIFTEIISSLLK